jgi:uncharacterized glyoxalase superfamily protein PhnB
MPKPAPRPVPEGMHNITAHLWFNGNCADALELYQRAFDADVIDSVPGPDGKGVMHSMIKLGDSMIMMADAWPGMWEQGPTTGTTAGIFFYTDDCDLVFDRAVDAGCKILSSMDDMFWGDRMGKLKDPFGHTWAIATNKLILTPDELQAAQEAWLASMKG